MMFLARGIGSGLDKLEGWPEKVRTMQRNWIGRSEGALVDFAVDQGARSEVQGASKTTSIAGPSAAPQDDKSRGEDKSNVITVFTTRVDTIFGATSVQLA